MLWSRTAQALGAILGLMTSQVFAAVVILEGNPPPSTPSSSQSAPTLSAPAEDSSAQPGPSPAPPADSAAVNSPAPASPAPVPSNPTVIFDDLPDAKAVNRAQLSVEMLPGQTVSIGSVVSFKVTSRQAGYVVLMDVDAAGHLTQIYPNTASLARTSRVNGNYVKPGRTFIVPLAGDSYAGVRYVVSPPNGQAIIIGVLSASPVQILDVPDVPAELLGQPNLVLAYLSKRMSELRIPGNDNRLRETKWSFDARPYTIQ